MPTLRKLFRDVTGCMAAGYLAVALFHPSVKTSAGLVAFGILSVACLVALALTRRVDPAAATASPEPA